MGRRRAEMKRKGLRMAPEKVKRRRLCCLLPVRNVVLLIEFEKKLQKVHRS